MNRKAIFERDHYTCYFCGSVGRYEDLQVSHLIPKISGGSSSIDNLITECSKCNRSKSSKEKLEMKEKNVDSEKLNEWVSKYFNNSVPENLCHYTNLNAAKGILDTREMWLSNVRTMNDPDELSYGYRIIAMALEELEELEELETRSTIERQRKLRKLMEVMQHLAEQKAIVGNAEIYLTCFSAARNTIRQWVTYGDTASGVSLMFANSINKNKEQMKRLLIARALGRNENNLEKDFKSDIFEDNTLPLDVDETVGLYEKNYFGFKEVDYVEEDKVKSSTFYKNLISQLEEAVDELFSDPTNNSILVELGTTDYVKAICEGTISRMATNFFIRMALWALSVKHHHWKDEKEWRLILLLHSSKVNNYNTHFLIKPGMMVPFIKYFISPRDILEICLGPKTNKTMTELALDYYIKANPIYNELIIEKSDIKMA
ncbi:HNH endonuclease [Bacillus toyonensis]|uniref:HNH endonuclease n=1 Tax=Bacillus toyonensis TaxID=155322 RepID=UPI001CD6DAA3|nr:HNH endonuclease [Bacillus toyonensis]MCA1042935.1 HNH endonuclease [Bacillus toyonensis]